MRINQAANTLSLKDIQQLAIDLLAKLPFEPLKDTLQTLLNTVEEKTVEVDQLKDEINRIKGDKIKITRKVVCAINRSALPADAQNKGTRSVVIQDLNINADNIEFMIERFYSPSLRQSFESELPATYRGHEFGPNLRSFVITLHYQCRITQKVLHTLLRGIGILISEGQIGEILLDQDLAPFAAEKEAVREAAIEKHGYQQIDDTGARINGANAFTIVTCNEDFCSFMTSQSKGRISALITRVFWARGHPRSFATMPLSLRGFSNTLACAGFMRAGITKNSFLKIHNFRNIWMISLIRF